MELILDEGRVYGARYFTIKPGIFMWVDTVTWNEMVEWCVETYGPAGSMWEDHNKAPLYAHRWYVNNAKFWFRNESDVTLFLLRWS